MPSNQVALNSMFQWADHWGRSVLIRKHLYCNWDAVAFMWCSD